jgi:redox-sensitive bicupin YhaK (pirin superfamily)
MIKKLNKENMGTSNLGWLESRFHFSFAQYYNPQNINFGCLRVLNDDIIHPDSGFDTHPHENMEIVTYITQGELTHKDSMGNEEILTRGEVQYLSAGDGIFHSEHNLNITKDLKLLQIWILPPKIVSPQEGDAPIKLYQDVNFYVSELDASKELRYEINPNRQIYFVQIEGSSAINGITLENGDACEITEENLLKINAIKNSHFLFIEMEKR